VPRSIRERVIHPISVRELEVTAVRDVTSGMRQVTLTGEQLGKFSRNGFAHPAFRSSGFDDDVKLIFCYPGEDEPVLPIQKDGSIEFPKGRRPISRNYTVRRFSAETGELEIEFLKHGTGIATTWALRCRPGDRIHVAGPAASSALPKGVDWMLVAGDETALPAIGRLLDEAPDGLRVQAFVEVGRPEHIQQFDTAAKASIRWLYRGDAEPGTTTLLADAVREAEWWPGDVFAWVAGETMSIKPIRRYLREERQVPKENVEVTGYWRRGEVVTLAADPAVPDAEQNSEPFDVLHEMGELLPPYALRAAVTLGIPELIVRGSTSVAEIAEGAGADPVAVGKLLRYLVALEVLTCDDSDRFAVNHVGELLTDEYVIDVLDVNGPIGRLELAYAGLLDSVRTGKASYANVFGHALSNDRADAGFEASWHEQLAKYARFVAPAIAADAAVARARNVVIYSDAAVVIAEAIAAASPEARVRVAGLPSAASYYRADLAASVPDGAVRERIEIVERSVFEASPGADAVLLIRALDEHPDADAVHALRQGAAGLAAGGTLLVIDHPLDEKSADEHPFEEDLKQLVVHGTGHRTDAEHRALFDRAGLLVCDTRVVGWGFTLYELRPR
jgi:NADPH-dependent ferric siderophore reductase